ncbi:hypothetical protein PX701_06050 [Agromyces sp. H3Y2-19a]|uniref:hypothetical protein n=1 Tax=Agromyces TaxID=33877 RepID=UPI0023B8ED48|nr:hypothetical protein [Agromyces chromiiresistens]MDF0513178.1 hypothetical protein [Agromyces chromiiresistens]
MIRSIRSHVADAAPSERGDPEGGGLAAHPCDHLDDHHHAHHERATDPRDEGRPQGRIHPVGRAEDHAEDDDLDEDQREPDHEDGAGEGVDGSRRVAPVDQADSGLLHGWRIIDDDSPQPVACVATESTREPARFIGSPRTRAAAGHHGDRADTGSGEFDVDAWVRLETYLLLAE